MSPRSRPFVEELEPRLLLANDYWLGTGTGKFSNPADWSLNRVPGGMDTAIFGDGTHNNNCTVDTSPTVQSLQVNNNYTGTIDIQAGNNLTTTGGGFVSGGTLLLESNATNFSDLSSSGTCTISITNVNGSGPSGAAPSGLVATGTHGELDLTAGAGATMNLGGDVFAQSGGKVVFKGGGTFAFNNPIPNGSTDIFVDQGCSLDIQKITAINIPFGGGANTLFNYGTTTKSTTDDETIQMAITNEGGGVFKVQGGVLKASGSQTVLTLDGSNIGTSFYYRGMKVAH